MPKPKLVGARATYVPNPVSARLCGLFPALSVMEIAPVSVPIVVGLNVTVNVQLAPAATLFPQLFVWLNGPVNETFEMLRIPRPVLVSVAVCDALVVKTTCVEKISLVGASVTAGNTPTPESATTCGLLGALSVNVRLPVMLPALPGIQNRFTVQAAPAVRAAPQLLVWVPLPLFKLRAMLERVSVTFPVLLRVTVCDAPVMPTV